MPSHIQPHSEVDRQNTSRVFSRSTHGKIPNENMNISDPWEIKKRPIQVQGQLHLRFEVLGDATIVKMQRGNIYKENVGAQSKLPIPALCRMAGYKPENFLVNPLNPICRDRIDLNLQRFERIGKSQTDNANAIHTKIEQLGNNRLTKHQCKNTQRSEKLGKGLDQNAHAKIHTAIEPRSTSKLRKVTLTRPIF